MSAFLAYHRLITKVWSCALKTRPGIFLLVLLQNGSWDTEFSPSSIPPDTTAESCSGLHVQAHLAEIVVDYF